MSDLKTVLKEIGATNQQLASPVVALCEKALTEREDFVSEITESRAKEICDNFSAAQKTLIEIGVRLENIESQTSSTIRNQDVRDSVIAYRNVLKTTKEIFGVDCTQEVICKAIEAGSYIAWRGIMGPKQEGVTRRI